LPSGDGREAIGRIVTLCLSMLCAPTQASVLSLHFRLRRLAVVSYLGRVEESIANTISHLDCPA
jgi:hypothetical protein